MSRKQTRRKRYDLVNPIVHAMTGAAITDTAALDKLRIRELAALEAFRTGAATRQEWMDVADFLNISETLARSGVGPEALEPCLRAQEALGAIHDRFTRTGKLGTSGQELQALREAYEYADLQRSSISRSAYEDAIRRTANRIRSAHPSVKVMVA